MAVANPKRGHGGAIVSFATILFGLLLAALSILPGCGEPAKKLSARAETSAELRTVRRGVSVVHPGEPARAPYARERLGEGAEIRIDDAGLAWLRRDGGALLLVRGPGKVTVEAAGLRVHEGRVFAETPPGVAESVQVPEGTLVLSAVRASVEVRGGSSTAYVLEGEVRAKDVVARAGELLSLDKDGGSVRPALAWEDWTGGLATTDPAAQPAPYGVGTVGARQPGAAGSPHAPLTIQRLDVRVKIEGDLAVTEVDQTFFNPMSETVEGIYRFRAPEGAALDRFGVDRDGGIAFGYVKEKKQAEAQYQQNVYQGSTEDPALLLWREPGVYEARLYPIGPGATRRVVVRYTEWLPRSGEKGERRLYVYPMASEGSGASAPHVEDLSISIDLATAGAREIRAGMGAARVGDFLMIQDNDIVPRADLAVELIDDGVDTIRAVRAKHVPDLLMLGPNEQNDARRTGKGEADYLLVPVRARDLPKRAAGLDLVVVVDTSAATDPSMLRLARAATRALLAHLGPNDRAAVFTGDDRLTPAVPGRGDLTTVDQALRGEILEHLARTTPGGATDLAEMLADAAAKVGPDRASAVVYIGDGAPTVGEGDLAAIRERLRKAPRAVRVFGLGIGDGANMALLAGLASGGFAERVADERGAAKSALRLFEMAERSAALGASVDLGPNVERVYPREIGAMVEGETALVVGRLLADPPKEITVKTETGARTVKVETKEIDDTGDLRRRWALGRLDELMSEGAGHSALVDLGVRQGIITPVTSIYVPTSAEMTPVQRRLSREESKKRLKDVDETRDRRKKAQEAQDVEEKALEELSPLAKADSTADNKEGGTGARAKGEEGKGKSSPAPEAAATAVPAAPPPLLEPGRAGGAAPPAAQAARPEKPKAPDPSKNRGASRPADAPVHDESDKQSAMSATPAVPGPAGSPSLQGGDSRVAMAGEDVPSTQREEGAKIPATEGVLAPEEAASFGYLDMGGAAEDRGVDGLGRFGSLTLEQTVRVHITVDDPGRIKRLCGPGADLPLEERRGLWRERLAKTAAQPGAVLGVYRTALALCEAPTVRERRALLLLGLDHLPTVTAKVGLYRLLSRDLGASDIVYRAILARVTTPAQMRELNQALGLVMVDSLTLEKTIKEAKDPRDLVEKLRALSTKYPADLALALRVIDALEDAGDDAAAREAARTLRQRSDADARVRTAVGELYLRLASRAEGAEQKESDQRDAKRAFGEIVEFSPEDPVARRRLGDLYRAHGFYEEATRQYETLARLVPDDPTVFILLAACAEGLGKLEEAVRWTEKAGQAGAPDATQGPHATARAFAAAFLAWGRQASRAANKPDEVKSLAARLDRVLGRSELERREGHVRVVLTWAHPEFHPTLWHSALGSPMPASEGDTTLGIAQAMLPDRAGGAVEVRVEPADLDLAARLGQKAILTVVFGEGKDAEVIDRREISFKKGGPTAIRFTVGGGKVEEAAR